MGYDEDLNSIFIIFRMSVGIADFLKNLKGTQNFDVRLKDK